MCGLHGVYVPRCVNTPKHTAMNITENTATGRRHQLFSPTPATNGNATRKATARAGTIRMNGVSMLGGKYESTVYSHRKKKSGFGTVWIMLGSGTPLGPYGPKTAAQNA